MSGNLGVNVSAQGMSGDNLLGYLVNDLKAQTATILNEYKVAEALPSRMKYPIFRIKGEGQLNDDSAYSNHDPVDFANLLDRLAPPGCWLYGGNEHGSANLDKQDTWTNRFVERCVELHRIPLVHNQFTQHPESGAAGVRQLASSTRAAMQAGGGVGPHAYWSHPPAEERKLQHRNAFSPLDEWREVFGGDLLIICSEIGFDESFGVGYHGVLDNAVYAEQLIEAAEILWNDFRAFGQVYGIFPDGSQWGRFNIWLDDVVKNAIAKWNRSQDMTFEQTIIPIPPRASGVSGIVTALPPKAEWRNLRDQPYDKGTQIVGRIIRGDALVVVEHPPQAPEDWVYVWKGNIEGWAWFSGVTFMPDAPTSPAETTYTVAQFREAFEAALSDLKPDS